MLQSASLRLRPILMTTFATVLGVWPLLDASGTGANSRFDIGLMITAGMLVGTLLYVVRGARVLPALLVQMELNTEVILSVPREDRGKPHLEIRSSAH